MSEIDGGPAFPIPNSTDMDGYVYAPEARGMSLRDWFAGQAMNAAMRGDGYRELSRPRDIADDAMLAARKGDAS